MKAKFSKPKYALIRVELLKTAYSLKICSRRISISVLSLPKVEDSSDIQYNRLVNRFIMATSSNLKVCIVGSGLAGLTAARVLREDHNVTVFERGSLDVAIGGQGITISP